MSGINLSCSTLRCTLLYSLLIQKNDCFFPFWGHFLSPQSWGPQTQPFPFSLSSISSHSHVFRYLTLLTVLLYPVYRRSASFLKYSNQRSNQIPVETWPTLGKVKSSHVSVRLYSLHKDAPIQVPVVTLWSTDALWSRGGDDTQTMSASTKGHRNLPPTQVKPWCYHQGSRDHSQSKFSWALHLQSPQLFMWTNIAMQRKHLWALPHYRNKEL